MRLALTFYLIYRLRDAAELITVIIAERFYGENGHKVS